MAVTEQPAHRRSAFVPVLILVVILVAAAAFLFAGWLPRHKQQEELDKESKEQNRELPRVNVLRVERAKAASELMIPGTTLAYTEAYIYARASGYVSKRLADIGDHVRAGQLLATIDAPDLDRQVAQERSSLQQSEANLVQLQAQLHLASLNWDRYKVLVAKGVFSRQDGDQQEANYRVAEANVRAAENTIQANRESLNRLLVLQQYERVQAPFSGVITARNVDVGALISASGSGMGSGGNTSPGPTLLAAQGNNQGASGNLQSSVSPATGGAQGGQMFSVAAVDRLRILVSVPESYTAEVHTGQRAQLLFASKPDAQIEGRVTRTSASIDQNTRTLLVEVQVQNRFGLVPGMYVMVNFVDVKGVRPVTIPGAAIVVRNARNTVALIQDNIVHYRPISVGRDYGDQTEVRSGLQAGDVIALNVTDEVQDGSRIDPQFPKTPPVGSGGSTTQGGQSGSQNQYGNQQSSDGAQKANGPGAAAGQKSNPGNASRQ